MQKILGIAIVLVLLSGAAIAEKPHPAASHGFLRDHSLRLGVDTELGIPLGNYADQNSVGGGAFVNGELALLDAISATMRVGFQAHLDRTLAGTLAEPVELERSLRGIRLQPEKARKTLLQLLSRLVTQIHLSCPGD